MYDKLFSLKVPSGWAIIRHSFGDVDPVIEAGAIVNDEFYNEDLLSIEAVRFTGEGWITDPAGYAMDLGWYPEASPDGCYRLTLLRGGWDRVILEQESRDRHQIHALIEQCFSLILEGAADDELAAQVLLGDLVGVC